MENRFWATVFGKPFTFFFVLENRFWKSRFWKYSILDRKKSILEKPILEKIDFGEKTILQNKSDLGKTVLEKNDVGKHWFWKTRFGVSKKNNKIRCDNTIIY